TSVSAPASAPAPAPAATPTSGFRNSTPTSRPQKLPPAAPAAVVFISWLSFTRPDSVLVAMTASPKSIRYSLVMPRSLFRISSAFSSLGKTTAIRSAIRWTSRGQEMRRRPFDRRRKPDGRLARPLSIVLLLAGLALGAGRGAGAGADRGGD